MGLKQKFLPPYGKALSIKERTLLAPLSLDRERGVGGIGLKQKDRVEMTQRFEPASKPRVITDR